MNAQKRSVSSNPGLKEVPARKKPVPTLQIPPDASPEEVKELTKKFMKRLRSMGALPTEPTSKQGQDQTESS